MGDILPFVAKVRSSGDWSPAERARLTELADRFSGVAEKVEVVFGTSDDGDPWCVVKDENEDILVHVAKIDGRFVVHYSLDDSVSEGAELPAALGERLSWDDASLDDVVVPFSRQAQSFIALLVAAAFFYETSQAAAVTEPAAAPNLALHDDATAHAAPLDTAQPEAKRDVTAHATALSGGEDPAPQTSVSTAAAAPAITTTAHTAIAATEPASAPTHAAPVALASVASAPVVMAAAEPAAPVVLNLVRGTSGDDHLLGTAGSDHLLGGAGADTLSGGGAPLGGYDLLDGGAGNDRIELGARVFAVGGQGADTFVIEAPQHMGDANQQLGVILDFHLADGDKLVTASGQQVSIVSTAQSRVAVPFNPTDNNNQPQSLVFVDGQRVSVDLDGDHQADGYVVLAGPPAAHAPAEPDPAPTSTEEPPPVLTGHALEHDLF
jgi:hypothetical protein